MLNNLINQNTLYKQAAQNTLNPEQQKMAYLQELDSAYGQALEAVAYNNDLIKKAEAAGDLNLYKQANAENESIAAYAQGIEKLAQTSLAAPMSIDPGMTAAPQMDPGMMEQLMAMDPRYRALAGAGGLGALGAGIGGLAGGEMGAGIGGLAGAGLGAAGGYYAPEIQTQLQQAMAPQQGANPEYQSVEPEKADELEKASAVNEAYLAGYMTKTAQVGEVVDPSIIDSIMAWIEAHPEIAGGLAGGGLGAGIGGLAGGGMGALAGGLGGAGLGAAAGYGYDQFGGQDPMMSMPQPGMSMEPQAPEAFQSQMGQDPYAQY